MGNAVSADPRATLENAVFAERVDFAGKKEIQGLVVNAVIVDRAATAGKKVSVERVGSADYEDTVEAQEAQV